MSRPRYRRHRRIKGHLDIINSKFIPDTPEQLADQAFDRKWNWLLVGLYSMIAAGLAVAVVLVILKQKGLLS